MPGPGRPPLPAATLKARGTFRPDRHAGGLVASPGRPVCPDWLPDGAKAEWRRVVPLLERMGALTKVDGEAVAGWCLAWDQVREATALIAREGMTFRTHTGYIAPHPAVGIRSNALDQLRRFGSLLGLSPADRMRLRGAGQPEPDDADTQRERKFFS